MALERAVLQPVAQGLKFRSFLSVIDYAAVSHTSKAFWWWRLSHHTSFVAMHAGGAATMKKACNELQELGLHLLEAVPGR